MLSQLTQDELNAALQRATSVLEGSAVRDYEQHGPYFESKGTRAALTRWQALEAERLRRIQEAQP